MEIRYPDYYKQFSCIAAACPDSCCHEWEVDVDPEAADFYRRLPGELGDRLREVLRDGEDGWASMAITEDRRCPMWRDDGLCRIQAELDHGSLCATCREFPRLRHDYGTFVELGLSMSCPEAARLILSTPRPVWVTEPAPGGTAPEYDGQTMRVLRYSREKALEYLYDETMPVGTALAKIYLYACQVQCATRWEEVEDFLFRERIGSLPLRSFPGNMADIFAVYEELEILTDRWRKILDRGPVEAPWLPAHRTLARYFIDRYWLQAVASEDLVTHVKFAVLSCLMIRHMGGDPVESAQLYSKEIENDTDNVWALYDAMEARHPLADLRLLDLLLAQSDKM